MHGFIMENPIKLDDLGVPLFSETSLWTLDSINISMQSKYIQTYLGNPWASSFINLLRAWTRPTIHCKGYATKDGHSSHKKEAFCTPRFTNIPFWRLPSPQKVEWHLRIFLGQFCFFALVVWQFQWISRLWNRLLERGTILKPST